MAKTYPWGGFANGLIPDAFLTKVRGEWFEKEAAAHLVQLEAAFTAHFGYPAIIVQGYRARGKPSDEPDVPTQWGLYNEYKDTDPLRAAYPGTSPHGYARSADFGSGVDQYGSQQKQWMDANAPQFGWHPTGNGFPRKEAWHFDYIPGTATAALDATPLEEDDMFTDDDRALLTTVKNALMDGGPGMPDQSRGLNVSAQVQSDALYKIVQMLPIIQDIHDAVFGPVAPSLPDAGRPIGLSLKTHSDMLTDIRNAVTQSVQRDGKNVSQAADNMNTGTLVRELATTLTPEAVAAAVAAKLPTEGGGPALTQEQLVAAFKEALSSVSFKATGE